jgi:hypothetical protein
MAGKPHRDNRQAGQPSQLHGSNFCVRHSNSTSASSLVPFHSPFWVYSVVTADTQLWGIVAPAATRPAAGTLDGLFVGFALLETARDREIIPDDIVDIFNRFFYFSDQVEDGPILGVMSSPIIESP